MAGLEPARAFYGPTDFKSVVSTISTTSAFLSNEGRITWGSILLCARICAIAIASGAEVRTEAHNKISFLERYRAPRTERFLHKSLYRTRSEQPPHLLNAYRRDGLRL